MIISSSNFKSFQVQTFQYSSTQFQVQYAKSRTFGLSNLSQVEIFGFEFVSGALIFKEPLGVRISCAQVQISIMHLSILQFQYRTFQYRNFNIALSISHFQYCNFNTAISIPHFQYRTFNSAISIPHFQFRIFTCLVHF